MGTIRNAEIAARLRALLSGEETPAALARRLHVDETALRMSIDDLSPYPTMDVIVAVVRAYGVDPHWLMTGQYDPGFHHRALESAPQDVRLVVNDIVEKTTGGHLTPPNLRLVR